MTALADRLKRLIAVNGPISVADYMAHCLFDPTDGYYTTREPFGLGGDFTTAPEISQMFGELVGIFLLEAWRKAGRPTRPVIAEIGPGRGTLMKDMLRILAQLEPSLADHAAIVLVETSPRLQAVQRATLASSPFSIRWTERVAELPPGPLFIVGNELFDAVPMRQYVRSGGRWQERLVGLDAGGSLQLVAGPGQHGGGPEAPDGSILEVAPARTAIMEEIAGRIASDGGTGLFVDYGYRGPAVGDTLQALRGQAFDGVLAHPGEADLTSHVDFAALADAAMSAGLHASILPQGEFLLRMGLLERAGRLGASADAEGRQAIGAAVERLAGPDQMGTLFKALAIHPPGDPPAPFTASDRIGPAMRAD